MRICSFLPAATYTLCQLGLADQVVGTTFECPGNKPKVVRSRLEERALDAGGIDAAVASAQKEGHSLYYIDEPLLAELAPDLIFTQDVCPVCQIDTDQVQQAVQKLPCDPVIVPLLPKRLEEVFQDILKIANATGYPDRGEHLLGQLRDRVEAIQRTLRSSGSPTKSLFFMEWPDPVFNSGHWIPDMIRLAGGFDPLANPGGYSRRMEWQDILDADPEVIVIAPCGLSREQSLEEMQKLKKQEGWGNLQAVCDGQVYLADGDLFTCPGPDLVKGIELLAGMLHPSLHGAVTIQNSSAIAALK